MKTQRICSNRKDQIKVIMCFKDGREIKAEEFDEKRDLTDEQRQFIVKAFEKVFTKKEEE